MKGICRIVAVVPILIAVLLSGCASATYKCDTFTVGKFKNWEASSESTKEYAGSSVYLKESGNGKAYIHLQYLGKTETEEGAEAENNVSFRTGDIAWKGVSEALMNETSLVISGVNEKTGERWQITGFQFDGSTENPLYTAGDVEKWVKTIKMK